LVEGRSGGRRGEGGEAMDGSRIKEGRRTNEGRVEGERKEEGGRGRENLQKDINRLKTCSRMKVRRAPSARYTTNPTWSNSARASATAPRFSKFDYFVILGSGVPAFSRIIENP
jgi:hypothetical protein